MNDAYSAAALPTGRAIATMRRTFLLVAAVAAASCAPAETKVEASDPAEAGIEQQRQKEFERATAEANRFEADIRERTRAASGEGR
ncbi:hypothetical protein [Sphingosinicella sp. CPCC 101087]|uniref:hypothetical protein n=1 Tax=Sphingosinicella sp. CPCC 101087 TaxID=2497754 RepID=UPI00101DACD7|nr:hypothetical protein [Sphingosinicella sp. CPCC 101087]